MSRVTPAEVKELTSTTLTDQIVQLWIDAADSIITSKAECIGKDDAGLAQISLYLSAHFVAMLDPTNTGQITKTKIDVFETSFNESGLSTELINKTPYGATANMLSVGCLLSTTKAKATVDFL
jgi:hypothetical protein